MQKNKRISELEDQIASINEELLKARESNDHAMQRELSIQIGELNARITELQLLPIK